LTIPIVALSPWKQTHPNAFVRMSVIGADEISKDATILRVLTDELIPNVDMLASFMEDRFFLHSCIITNVQ
jgi:hypothetical protein